MKPADLQDVYELSPIQEGMLFHSLLDPESGVYVEQLHFTLRGALDVDAFRRAWQAMVDRHPIFRTGFHWEEVGKALQAVHAAATIPVEQLDWRDVPAADRERHHSEFAREERRRGFDLRRPPLMRIVLIRLEDELYRFFWSFPHIVMDGWSFGLALQEFAALYAAHAQGQPIELPPARPYRDYVAWWKRQDMGEAETYWRRTLAGFEPAGALESGPAPRPQDGDAGPTHGFVPDASLGGLVRDLQQVARDHRLTLNTIVQGAWLILLSRYLGRDDVICGATSTHRPATLPGAQTIVGPMLSTMPVRARVEPDEPLVAWLQRLQSSMAEARDHGDVPLHLFGQWAGTPHGAPLFETDLAFENAPAPEIGLHGLEVVDFGYDGRPHYPLTMVVFPQEDLPPRLIYDRRRFTPEAAARLLGHFRTILESIAAAPGARVGDVEMLTAEERRQLLVEWAATTPQEAAPCLHERFAAQAARTPNAIAAVCGRETLTYRELDEQANRLAHRLRALGAGPGQRVGLCLGRSLHTLTGVLGVLKSGAAYVPLDLSHPAERMAYILRDADVTVLVTHQAAADRAPSFDGPVLCLDKDAAAIAAEDATAPTSGAEPGDLAYVIYTSGSTGRPKGVQVTHANVVRLVTGAGTLFGFRADDVWSLFHSYAFDVSVFEMWGAFLNGARLVVVPHDTTRSAEALHALVREQGVTVLSQTPSAFRPFMEADRGHDPAQLSLRYVVFAGEYLDTPLLAPWIERHGDDRPHLVNMYGITETTVHSTFRRITAADLDSPVRSNIGRPLPDLRIHLLDPHGRPVPVGVPGEIHVSGPGVARGYQNLPELTAERFLPDPFTDDPEARMYRSGDIARRLENGELESIGRADFQVKIRGFRVEPGEIEAVLAAHPRVREAVVTARPHGPGDTRLVAYVVPDGPGDGLAHDLRGHARARLPEYMVPTHVVELAAMPLTANGKIDRRALPEPDAARPDLAADYVAPRTPAEKDVAQIWGDVLGVERVGVHDDFFDLGGHSLLATRVVSRLRAVLGADVTVRTLFDRPTVAGLCAALAEREAAAGQEGAGQRAGEPHEAPQPIAARPRVAYRAGAQGSGK
jgi:surfactin family lipopeptide synthetase C